MSFRIKALKDDKSKLSYKISQLKNADKTYEKASLVQIDYVDSLNVIRHK